MDFNRDGKVDLVTGIYAEKLKKVDSDFAGHPKIALGKGGIDFGFPLRMKNVAGNGLLPNIPAEDPSGLYKNARLCTHPFLADLNQDGLLDVVIGGFNGKFIVSPGKSLKGKPSFSTKQVFLKDNKGKLLSVAGKSAPHIIDWDRDGDLDILSGDGSGAISIAYNIGTVKKPKFAAFTTLIPSTKARYRQNNIIDGHRRGPNARIHVTDWNNDGVLDILCGDRCSIRIPRTQRDPLKAKQLKQNLAIANAEYRALLASPTSASAGDKEKVRESLNKLKVAANAYTYRSKTGCVWVYLGKKSAK